MLNDRLMLTERGFLDSEGLLGRQWFKHLVSTFFERCALCVGVDMSFCSVWTNSWDCCWMQIYGPRGNSESKMAFFPGIDDAISQNTSSRGDKESMILHEIWRVSRAIQRAAFVLRGDFTWAEMHEIHHLQTFYTLLELLCKIGYKDIMCNIYKCNCKTTILNLVYKNRLKILALRLGGLNSGVARHVLSASFYY